MILKIFIKLIVGTIVINCNEAIDKFTYESMLEMSLVDIDIARLRLIPFYYKNCKKTRNDWEKVANQFDDYYYKKFTLFK